MDPQTLFSQLPGHYQSYLLDVAKLYNFNHLDPSAYSPVIDKIKKDLSQESGQRPGAESLMNNYLNSLENFGTYFSTGKMPSGSISIFHQPDYSRIKGYR